MMQDTLVLPERATQEFNHIAPGVIGTRIVMVNVYAITAPDGSWMLVDAGLPFSAGRIERWCEENFNYTRPRAIVMTHGHFDHVGALKTLADLWNVPVYAHALEMPYLTGRSSYPPPDPAVGGGAMALMSCMYPRGPVDVSNRLQELPEDGSIPGMPGWRWIHTPGHTAGHISLFRDEDRVLIAGDAFVTTKQESVVAVATQRRELHGPPAYFTSDWDAAKLSVQRLAGLYPSVLATGHGQPMVGPEAGAALQYLADQFDIVARPSQGRYVRQPAVTDERGVVRLPPAVPNPATPFVLGAVAAACIWYGLSSRQKRRAY